MSEFSDRLAKARAARPYKDVRVVLDGELSEEIERLRTELDAADQDFRLGVKSEAAQIEERIAELTREATDVEVLRFTRLPGRAWSALTSQHPARPGIPVDAHYGYNYDAVCEAAAAYRDERTGEMFAHRMVDGEPVELLVETKSLENVTPVNEWAELFDTLAGHDVERIRDVVWTLNEYEASERLQALVLGLGAAGRSDSQ